MASAGLPPSLQPTAGLPPRARAALLATWLRLLLRALRSDGCSGRGLSTGTAMLEQALALEGISVDQYINIFQFISRTVEQLIRIRFLDVYEGVARRIVGQMIERGHLEAEPDQDPQETVLKVSEGFLRDLISESFGLQQLDSLVGKVLRTLVSGREKLEPEICLIDKAAEIGAHSLSGAVMDPKALDQLMPDWRTMEPKAPVEAEVHDDYVLWLSEKGGTKLPITPPPLKNHGNFVISLNKMVGWLGGIAEEKGVQVFPGFPAATAVRSR